MRNISLIGTIIKERYCVMEKIGKGGEGQVYLARDMELGIYRAVKVLPVSEKQEADFLGRLEHPAIPKILDYSQDDQFCYVVMEYIKGKTLGQCLREGKHFSTDEIFRIAIAVTQILDTLHQKQPPVFYGDLKPDNLMVSNQKKLYLIDFGSAKQGYGGAGVVVRGTPGFAAPEQYEGKVSVSSDIYGLGKTLQILTGKRRLYFPLWGFSWIIFRCCSKKFFRFKNIRQIEKYIRRWQSFYKVIKRCCFGILIAAAVVVIGRRTVKETEESKPVQAETFEQALTEITEIYYAPDFISEKGGKRKKLTQKAEKKLLKIMKQYPEDREQKKILLLLAFNSECGGKTERAGLYYEQLLLYYPDYQEGYAQYGIFLWENGKKEESRKLWEEYNSEPNREKRDQEWGWNMIQWEQYLREKES